MATKQPQNFNQTFILLALAFFLIGGVACYKYAIPNLKTAKTALAQKKAQNQGLIDDIANLSQAKSAVDDAQTYLKNQLNVDPAQLRYVFPPTEDVPALYLQMEELARTQGIEGATYQISPPAVDQDGLVRIPVTISATASYTDLKHFMSDLQLNIRPISLVTVSFSQAVTKDGTAPDSGKMTMSATGFVRAASLSSAYSIKATK